MTDKKENTGIGNAGNKNAGDDNTGNFNTGDDNTGDYNAGNKNAGNFNTGDINAGKWNAGDYNAGDRNVGDYNAGDYNAGDFNTGIGNVGYCNTITPENILIFNKPAKREDWNNATKPKWIYVNLTKWIEEAVMSDKEKEAYPGYVTTGGYLKLYTSLKHAYVEAWEKASEYDKALIFKLPNFDFVVFKEIFGFNPCKNTVKEPEDIIELNGIKYKKID